MNKADNPMDSDWNLKELMTSLEVIGLVKPTTSIDAEAVVEATDCQKLATLIAGLQQAYHVLCETCKPADPTGPTVCDLGNFAPKAVE